MFIHGLLMRVRRQSLHPRRAFTSDKRLRQPIAYDAAGAVEVHLHLGHNDGHRRWRTALLFFALGLVIFSLCRPSLAFDNAKPQISAENKEMLRVLHSDRWPASAKFYIITSCTIIDRYIYFHGGCHWLPTWEQNIGRRLGRGLDFLMQAKGTKNALNFAFSVAPLDKTSLQSTQVYRRILFGDCVYVAYDVGGERLDYVFMGQNKQEYNRCITRSILEYLSYGKNLSFSSGGPKIELLALRMMLSTNELFDIDLIDATETVNDIVGTSSTYPDVLENDH